MIRPLALCLIVLATPAQAELSLCNRTSYVVETAIGLERTANVATRGWFRLDPGQCRKVLDEPLNAELAYVHARTPEVYGSAPLPRSGHGEFCIGARDFTFANARNCSQSQMASFTAVKPSDTPNGPSANLAEESDYDDTQARLAGIQRLLAIAGYDAYPIDGVQGAKTSAALAQFIKDRKLPADAASAPDFFDTLLAAAGKPEGFGFSWCNDTKYPVMAALGTAEKDGVVTRGWYRVDAGKCLRPDVRGDQRKLYSYAEAVDGDGRAIKRGDTPLAWGGTVALCTRDGKFELSDHKDCAARGLNSAGFAAVDMTQPATTIHFKDQ